MIHRSGVISLFIKENNEANAYPYDKTTMDQITDIYDQLYINPF